LSEPTKYTRKENVIMQDDNPRVENLFSITWILEILIREKPSSSKLRQNSFNLWKVEVRKPNLKEEKELWRRRVKYPITTDFHGFPNIIEIEEKEFFEQIRKFSLKSDRRPNAIH
jgi:hypothetical protein